MSLVIGLTGGIASGKSTVVELLKKKNAVVVDADWIARQVVEPGTFAYKRIVREFGTQVVGADRKLDRTQLGRLIFGDESKRRQLNRITHPWIIFYMIRDCVMSVLMGRPFIVLDVPLLFETRRLLWLCTVTVVVVCDRDQQIDRLVRRNHLSREEALQRIDSQMPLQEKAAMAHFVLDNSGSLLALEEQVENLWQQLQCIRKQRLRYYKLFGTICFGILVGIPLCRSIATHL
ncbi:Dephospho-CoA kinase domain-containing protein [Galdieria sulphuraria]|uniref:Dephospho-CoA kinase n=1 Tax=Galdieria sulphuraria TaxID=130081 RepID=M2WZJ1_GALSU|nr:dephospho-CoA kinase [Galdieria sulphuraria]EME29500.1 dephospho-CoA kinase [Galdieria sulphuraria]GJD05981.1 Dephospho-CoA kinase domain-containing protein [Galdieria sulphuraria]|eukprot:XP_005706020.1 dephospho-CoA kinase [Galdieria sulphuraria]